MAVPSLAAALAFLPISLDLAAQGNDRVAFPADYAEGVHYATVQRGNIREALYTSREAIAAAQRGEPLPDGTVILMEDFRDGALYRYVVMEKRAGWGERYDSETRNGDWEFQSFRPDRSINRQENVTRCMSCHKSQAATDYVFTLGQMKAAAPISGAMDLRDALALQGGASAHPGDLSAWAAMLRPETGGLRPDIAGSR